MASTDAASAVAEKCPAMAASTDAAAVAEKCPATASSDADAVAKLPAVASTAAERKVTIRVLLVEDEVIHRVVARALMKAVGGVQLDEAGDGAEAVRLVREGAYDLIITDKQMPVMDGHEATRRIRALGVTTPIVGLSSDCLAADVDAFIKAGADDFTPKPLSKEKLNHILTKFHLEEPHEEEEEEEEEEEPTKRTKSL